MVNEQWDAIHTVFKYVDDLLKGLKPLSKDDDGDKYVSVDSDEVIRIRADLRVQLDFLKVKLSENLSERDCYLVIFPIVAYLDEYIQEHLLDIHQLNWPLLQKELFQIVDGGEVFYETIDDIMRKPQTIPFIYEVYYFCLMHGFRGKYNDNPVKINEYLKNLKTKISVNDNLNIKKQEDQSITLKPIGSIKWYYLAAVIIFFALYFLLNTFAEKKNIPNNKPEYNNVSEIKYNEPNIITKKNNNIKQNKIKISKHIKHPVESPKPMDLRPIKNKDNNKIYTAMGRNINGRGISIQIASLKEKNEADNLVKKYRDKGYCAYIIDMTKKGVSFYRIRIGAFNRRKEAKDTFNKLKNKEHLKPIYVNFRD